MGKEGKEIQLAAEKNDMKAFYSAHKEVYGPQKKSTTQLLDVDGEMILNDKIQILNRFAQHFSQLLKLPSDTDHQALNSITQKPKIPELDVKPSFDEMLKAIKATKENKAPGSVEYLLKYGSTVE